MNTYVMVEIHNFHFLAKVHDHYLFFLVSWPTIKVCPLILLMMTKTRENLVKFLTVLLEKVASHPRYLLTKNRMPTKSVDQGWSELMISCRGMLFVTFLYKTSTVDHAPSILLITYTAWTGTESTLLQYCRIENH